MTINNDKNSTKYCSDIIAFYDDKLVLVERLTFPKGLALPGGKRDTIDGKLEECFGCANREMKEETGLDLKLDGYFREYSTKGRDPRWNSVSDVFYGNAYGEIKNESGKTKVVLVDLDKLPSKDNFAFDHYEIIQDWIQYKNK